MRPWLFIALLCFTCSLTGAHAAVDDDDDETDLRPWICGSTARLLQQIQDLHGRLVIMRPLPDGRSINTYQNELEEVTLEHNPDQQSCLISQRRFPADQQKSTNSPVDKPQTPALLR